MKYESKLESRPCAPMKLPEIPRSEMVIPMPAAWLEEMNRLGIDPARVVSEFVCRMFSYQFPGAISLNSDFFRKWGDIATDNSIAREKEWKRILVPIRSDAWQCIEQAAYVVQRPVHEVFLKVLARQIKATMPREKECVIPVSSAALEALAAAGVSLESAVTIIAPRDEQDVGRRAGDWKSRSTSRVWSCRRALKWMQAAPHPQNVSIKISSRQWDMIERVAAAIGISPRDWCLSAIGYRAALEMRRPLK